MCNVITFLITGFVFNKVSLLPMCVRGGDNDPGLRQIFIAKLFSENTNLPSLVKKLYILYKHNFFMDINICVKQFWF